MTEKSATTLILQIAGEDFHHVYSVFEKEKWPYDSKELSDFFDLKKLPGFYQLIIILNKSSENNKFNPSIFNTDNIPLIYISNRIVASFRQLRDIYPSLIDYFTYPFDNDHFEMHLFQLFKTIHLKERIELLSQHYSHKTEELINALEQDKKNQEELKQLDKIKSDFTSTISHELRTPISAMKGAVSTLQSNSLGTLNQEQQEFVNIIGRNADRLKSLVSDFLDFSQLNAGKIQMNFSLIPLSIPVLEAINTFKAIMEKQEITLTSDIPQHLPPVKIDNVKIIQVMNNLLNNAVKFTTGKGKIHVTISGAKETSQKTEFIISIADSGIGIPNGEISRIFEKFSQVDNTATRNYGGTGLGLSICKGIVEAHGGKIWAESILNQGSTIYFSIPDAR